MADSFRLGYVRRLSWCKAKYPYTDVCWSAEHGRIINQLACQNCELNKFYSEPKKKGGRREVNFY